MASVRSVITIKGERQYLLCAVDQDCFSFEVLVQKDRNTKAAKRDIGLTVCYHHQPKGLNNRAENFHQRQSYIHYQVKVTMPLLSSIGIIFTISELSADNFIIGNHIKNR